MFTESLLCRQHRRHWRIWTVGKHRLDRHVLLISFTLTYPLPILKVLSKLDLGPVKQHRWDSRKRLAWDQLQVLSVCVDCLLSTALRDDGCAGATGGTGTSGLTGGTGLTGML